MVKIVISRRCKPWVRYVDLNLVEVTLVFLHYVLAMEFLQCMFMFLQWSIFNTCSNVHKHCTVDTLLYIIRDQSHTNLPSAIYNYSRQLHLANSIQIKVMKVSPIVLLWMSVLTKKLANCQFDSDSTTVAEALATPLSPNTCNSCGSACQAYSMSREGGRCKCDADCEAYGDCCGTSRTQRSSLAPSKLQILT